ncbi:MAG: hypothetical protein M3Y22_18500 [Pseudomonadota bacterium]|nr:hypothetical protein [Pseudomonadota bacterium]
MTRGDTGIGTGKPRRALDRIEVLSRRSTILLDPPSAACRVALKRIDGQLRNIANRSERV